ncbi:MULTISPECIES: hypothetical protein [unclassified Rhizobium]|uniref:hypothetical protein n=1 Tax=unclassified Rhizobium TaxID=2613769 RepID=UPI0018079E04|nr:hypothetical protein [Rhizobium sp. UBA1881]
MSDIVASESDQAAASEMPLWRMFLVVYATALAMVLFDAADGILFVGDIDDQLRELQIRHLMSPQGHWFDLSLPFISMPAIYVSPWSRLVDLPYVAIAWLLQTFMPTAQGLSVAFQVWPPMMLSICCLLVAATARRLLAGFVISETALTLSLMIATVLMSIGVAEFSPGRIDHHNVQIVALLMIVAGLVRWDRAGGLMIGAGAAISTVIGLECLPFVVIAYGGLVLCYICNVAGVRAVLVASSVSMASVTLLSAMAFIGPAGAVSTQCDAFSAPYIFLLCGFAAILGACAAIQRDRSGPLQRLLALAIPAGALLIAAAFFFPSCMSGPYGIIDPLSRELWFERIWQEKSILYFYQNDRRDLLVLLALTAAIAAFVGPVVRFRMRERSFGPAIAYLMALGALILTVFVTRNIRFPIALMPVFLPAVIATMTIKLPAFDRAYRLSGVAVAAIAVALCLSFVLLRSSEHTFDEVDYMTASECAGQDFSVLDAVPPGRVAVPQGIALPLIMAAPSGFSVAAMPFHRASPGMKRMFQAFMTSHPQLRREALAPFDYVAVCRFPLEADPKQAPLYAALARGDGWPGLERIASPARSDFQLFRIDHAALR